MATPNYGYEKRQRELAKKKKKEEKARAKASGKPFTEDDNGMNAGQGNESPVQTEVVETPDADKPA